MNLTLLFVDQTSAIISWTAPTKEDALLINGIEKYRTDVVYKIRCSMCNSNVMFNPSTDTFNETKITLTNLDPVTTYTVQIHATNGVSHLVESGAFANETYLNSEMPFGNNSSFSNSNSYQLDLSEIKTNHAEIVFTTESVMLSTVFNLRVVAITNKDADLIWDKPGQSDAPVELYEVRWFPKSELEAINKTTLSTKETKARIDNLMENTEYGFQVRCKTVNGFGSYSNMVYAQTHQSVGSGN